MITGDLVVIKRWNSMHDVFPRYLSLPSVIPPKNVINSSSLDGDTLAIVVGISEFPWIKVSTWNGRCGWVLKNYLEEPNG
jgi:hypothetical protein